ncbi:peptidase inhibitor family I36 protein [Streptomyces sp. QTS52]
MRKKLPLLAGVAFAATVGLTAPQTASAAPKAAPVCPVSYFCVTTDDNFNGLQINWYGDDGYWESNINNQDSSWANRGTTGPGIPASVQVYDGFWQLGARTICVNPGSYVFHNDDANDRGSSHEWTRGC